MNNTWLEHWNNRYRQRDYAFGVQPNEYLKEQLEHIPPGTMLFPAEGEGRNAVFAARLGWEVSAFDISTEGKKKALRLASANHVAIDYQVGELPDLNYGAGQFDAIALIYAHFPAAIKSKYHQLLDGLLRSGGIIIFEAFSKKHVDYRVRNEKVGGPKDIASLFSIAELTGDFENYEFIELQEKEVDLNEGPFHSGTGAVIRMVARKK